MDDFNHNQELISKEVNMAAFFQEQNPDKYYSLCKSHLKFIVDSGPAVTIIDELFKDIEKASKKGFYININTPYKRKGNKSGNAGSVPLDRSDQAFQLIDFISNEECLKQEGIFRKTGNLSRQRELKERITQGGTLNLDDGYSVHDVASTLKWLLGELPEPLLTDRLHKAISYIPDMVDLNLAPNEATRQILISKQITVVQLLFLLLPKTNKKLLENVLGLLHRVASIEENKMTASNLAIMFAPHLLCPRKMSANGLHEVARNIQQAVCFLIENAQGVIRVPTNFMEDMKKYRKQCKGSISEKSDLSGDELDCGKTKYKFQRNTAAMTYVDRQKTAEATAHLDTQVALAELYAQVQAMPESTKKRKLLKQFNRANGSGTPAAALVSSNTSTKKHKRSGSLGMSIKNRFKGHKRRGSDHDTALANVQQQPVVTPYSINTLQSSHDTSLSISSQSEVSSGWSFLSSSVDSLSCNKPRPQTVKTPVMKLFKNVIDEFNTSSSAESDVTSSPSRSRSSLVDVSPLRVVDPSIVSPVCVKRQSLVTHQSLTPIDPSRRKRKSSSPAFDENALSPSKYSSSQMKITVEIVRSPPHKQRVSSSSVNYPKTKRATINHPAYISPMTHNLKKVSKQLQVPGNRCKIGDKRTHCFISQEAIMTPGSRKPMILLNSPSTQV